MGTSIQQKNSTARGIRTKVVEEMPNLEGIIDVIMPKKSPVYVIKWCVSLSRSTGSPLSLSLFISFSLSVYLSYLLPLHPFISVFTPYSSLHLSYS